MSAAGSSTMPDGLPAGLGAARELFALLGSTRAIREFRPDPVDPDLLEQLVWAATRAASPSNSQLWHFVIVTDPDVRRRIRTAMVTFQRWVDTLPPTDNPAERRMRDQALRLFDRLGDAPALIVICAENAYPPERPHVSYVWSAVGTASQNLLVAARALGLGATLTMFHIADEARVAEVLGIPEGVRIGAIVPVGWPATPHGPVRRRPLHEVLHRDGW